LSIEDLETANEKLIEVVASDQPRQSTIWDPRPNDMKVLKEDDVLHHIVETEGAVSSTSATMRSGRREEAIDPGACWATWSVPFDKEEEFSSSRRPIT